MDKVVYTYVCMQVSMYQPQARFFSTEHDVQERQHLRDEVGTWQSKTKQRAVIPVKKRRHYHEDCQF